MFYGVSFKELFGNNIWVKIVYFTMLPMINVKELNWQWDNYPCLQVPAEAAELRLPTLRAHSSLPRILGEGFTHATKDVIPCRGK